MWLARPRSIVAQRLDRDLDLATRAVVIVMALCVVAGAFLVVFGPHPALPILGLAACLVAPLILREVDLALLALVAVITLLPFGALRLGIGFNPTLLDPALGALYLIWLVRRVTRTGPDAPPPGLAPLGHPPPRAGEGSHPPAKTDLASHPLPRAGEGSCAQREDITVKEVAAARSGVGVAPLAVLVMGVMIAALLAGLSGGLPAKNQLRTFAELLLGTGLALILGSLLTDARRVRRLFLGLTVCGSLAALVGLVLYVLPDGVQVRILSLLGALDYPTGPSVLRFLNDDPTRLQRATGTAVDPNSFGGLLAVVTALVLPQLISRAPSLPRRAAIPMVAVLGLALLATVSRGSVVGLAAGMAVIGLLRDRRWLVTGLIAGALLFVLARLLPWTSAFVDHFLAGFQGVHGADRATQMRLGEYKDALRLIARYPLIGVGFGGPRDVDLYRGVSSLYLIIAETMGYLGLAAFLAAMGACLARLTWAWRTLSERDPMRDIVLGVLAALVAALVSGLFDHYFFTYPHAYALLWLVLAMGMTAARERQQLKLPAKQRKPLRG